MRVFLIRIIFKTEFTTDGTRSRGGEPSDATPAKNNVAEYFDPDTQKPRMELEEAIEAEKDNSRSRFQSRPFLIFTMI